MRTKSMQYLKHRLFIKYSRSKGRPIFTGEDLWKKPREFQAEYPVILSTTFSSRSSLYNKSKFDYAIMDEASQVDIPTGALALSNAGHAVIVGDSKQLPNVLTDDDRKLPMQCFILLIFRRAITLQTTVSFLRCAKLFRLFRERFFANITDVIRK